MNNKQHEQLRKHYKSDFYLFKEDNPETEPGEESKRTVTLAIKVLADWVVIGRGATSEEAVEQAVKEGPNWRNPNDKG